MDDIGVIWTVASVITGAVLAVASFVGWWQRWVCLMISFLPLVVATLFWAPSANNGFSRIGISGIVGAICGALLLIGAAQLLHGESKAQLATSQETPMPKDTTPPPQSFTGSGNFSVNQHGGSVNQTYINQAPPKLTFSPALGAELLVKIPKDKPLAIMAVGSQSDWAVGEQINNFLRANGFRTTFSRIGMLAPPPDHSLVLNDYPNARELIVAPGVR